VIAKVLYGTRTYGLLRYLYGPGQHEEHRDAHLVASWDGMELDPARAAGATLRDLATHLDRPVSGYAGTVARHVWHTSVRCAPGDPTLSDEQWAQVARRLVAAAGVAPMGDVDGCRWVAIRHADDHIHIVATLVRQDNRQPNLHGDFFRLREECRRIEADFGLRQTGPADRSAVRRPTRAEHAKAHRIKIVSPVQPSRQFLAGRVRAAAVVAVSEGDFFVRLERAGLLVKKRTLPSGDAIGYTVAVPGDRARDGITPIWYSGSRLAPDLSLPRIRQRFRDIVDGHESNLDAATEPASESRLSSRAQRRAEAWRQGAAAVRAATRVLADSGNTPGAAVTAALADLLTATADQAPRAVRDELVVAARSFERAGRVPWQADNEASRRTRSALRTIALAGPALGSADETVAVLLLVVAAVAAARAVAAHYRARQMHAHASAAHVAGQYLRAATERLGTRPVARPDYRAAARPELREVVRVAVGGRADPDAIVADPAWPALAGMLQRVEAMGRDPVAVLSRVTAQRRLRDPKDPARSAAQVLTWRLQNWVASQLDAALSAGEMTADRESGGAYQVAEPAVATAPASEPPRNRSTSTSTSQPSRRPPAR
jgi:hypothetical protein